MVYTDDIVSAFRHVKYHPDASAAYAYVYSCFLLLPVGALFGGRDSPGWFSLTSELRAFASLHLSILQHAHHPLVDKIVFDSEPPAHDALVSVPSATDVSACQASALPQSRGPHNCFVDDTTIVEYRSFISEAVAASILSAELFYGTEPHTDAPVSAEKFLPCFSHYCRVLGFDIDTRKMLVIFPLNKRVELHTLLDAHSWNVSQPIPLKLMARLLGKLRHASRVLPFGDFLTFHIQEDVNRFICCYGVHGWHQSFHFSRRCLWSVTLLRIFITGAAIEQFWARPISLLVPRPADCLAYSDASSSGLGGFSDTLQFQWRLAISVFSFQGSSSDPGEDQPHINILEFIAIIINIYLCIIALSSVRFRRRLHLHDEAGILVNCWADNTSALSWMAHASRSHSMPIRNLSLFLVSLVYHANSLFPVQFSGCHIAGMNNLMADALSRPLIYPSYNSIFAAFPALQPLRRCQVPQRLIAMILSCLSPQPMEVPSEATIKKLLVLQLNNFNPSAN
jgi:hypothetical protein